MKKSIALALSLLAACVWANSTPQSPPRFQKNGLPCFADICVGDRLDSLGTLNFKPGPQLSSFDTHPRTVSQVAEKHRKLFGFWDDAVIGTSNRGIFDSSFISLAGRYEGFCPQNAGGSASWWEGFYNVRGEYTTESGLQTFVTASLLPDVTDPGLPARYIVTKIERLIRVADVNEYERLKASFTERYTDFIWTPSRPAKPADVEQEGVAIITPLSSRGTAQATLSMRLVPRPANNGTLQPYRMNQLARHQRCASAGTPSLD